MIRSIEYENRVVAFIDILGFAERIKRTQDKDAEHITVLAKAFLKIRDLLSIDEPEEEAAQSRQITQFSDSIVVSFDLDEEKEFKFLLEELLHLQIELLKYDLHIRGGIYYGSLYHTDKILFGPALVKAYRLESKAANSPRIILPKSIHDYFKVDEIENLLLNDVDDFLYLDYFDCWMQELIFSSDMAYVEHMKRLKTGILKGLRNEKPAIYSKYGWMKTKWNNTVKKYKSSGDGKLQIAGRKDLRDYFEKENLILEAM